MLPPTLIAADATRSALLIPKPPFRFVERPTDSALGSLPPESREPKALRRGDVVDSFEGGYDEDGEEGFAEFDAEEAVTG
jgi:hypothetical protein